MVSAQSFPARRLARIVLAGLLAVALTPTAAHATRSDHSDSKKKVTVTAAFFPLAAAVAQVGGSLVKVTNLTPAGVEPHDIELNTQQAESVLDADLAVVVGNGFQPQVEDIAADRDGPTLNVLKALPINAGDKKVEEGDATALDPHVWLDPVLYQSVVDAIASALSKVDPDHAADYTANAVAYNAKLATLNTEYETGLANCSRQLLVTAHEAFGWLTQRYGLTPEGIAGISPDAEPNPQRLADLTDLVEKKGVTTIYTEDLVSPKVARTLAREAGGLKTATLNPLEGLTAKQIKAGATYISEMQDNLQAIQKGLGCSA
jgi:zinc transport system substrate-binding protein